MKRRAGGMGWVRGPAPSRAIRGCPEWLIAQLRHAYRGNSGPQARRRGAGAGVMDDGRHPGEEPLVRHVADDDRVPVMIRGPGEACLPGLDH